MICAFNSLVELKDCVENLEKGGCPLDSGKNIRVCKLTQWAYDETGSDVEESSFYTLTCSQSADKVKVGEDNRTFVQLTESFPNIGVETIEAVWNSLSTWDACFNKLSSFLSDRDKIKVDNCGFLLTDVLWPALEVGESNDTFEWSVRELDASLAGLSLEIEKNKQITEGWHILDSTEIPFSGSETSANNSKPVISYKDVVVRGEEIAREIPELVPLPRAPVAAWQPKFQVNTASKRRVDKLYMGNAPTKAEEHDEDFDCEYFESQVFLKGSVGVQRKLAVTKIRPKALDQKMKRIAEKVKV